MELKEFIAQALCDIVAGVKEAQSKTDKGTIVPAVRNSNKAVEMKISSLTTVDFEVTVNTVKRAGSEAKLNVVAAFVGGSVKGESASSDGHAAKLSFRVPVNLPTSER